MNILQMKKYFFRIKLELHIHYLEKLKQVKIIEEQGEK